MPKSLLGERLRAKGATVTMRNPPTLWQGPEDPGPMGGVTQSIINKLIGCPERARLELIEGWKRPPQFNHRMDYGNLWHACEEALSNSGNPIVRNPVASAPWERALFSEAKRMRDKYPHQQEDVAKWFTICRTQFPIYVNYWKRQPDNLKRTPLMQERVFRVAYPLPSGRVVWLRGKFDAVDLIGREVYLQENKTKGDIDQESLVRQLRFDLQTMLYLVALRVWMRFDPKDCMPSVSSPGSVRIGGVRYNVIRRPFAGGKGSIRQGEGTQGSTCPKCKGAGKAKVSRAKDAPIDRCQKCQGRGRVNAKPPESDAAFYGRLRDIIEGEPEYWFMRWKVEVTDAHVDKFERQFLIPFLENLCSDYEWWKYANENGQDPFDTGAMGLWHLTHVCCRPPSGAARPAGLYHRQHPPRYHWRQPFGVTNVLAEYGQTDLDFLLDDGNTTGLHRQKTLFTELA